MQKQTTFHIDKTWEIFAPNKSCQNEENMTPKKGTDFEIKRVRDRLGK